MLPGQLQSCLSHLDAAEALLEADGDLVALARLSFVIDMLRIAHELPGRISPDSWHEQALPTDP